MTTRNTSAFTGYRSGSLNLLILFCNFFNFQTLFFFSLNCEDVINNYVELPVLHID